MVAAVVVVATLVACGGADVGEECDEEGKADKECVDGAVCGKDKTGKLMCLTQCTTDIDCPAGYQCSGVSNTNLKGCRPK